MKRATKQVVDQFPVLASKIDGESTCGLNEVEQTFLALCRFFEKPHDNPFDLRLLYQNLSGDWLSFAMESILFFFQDDSLLLPKKNYAIIRHDRLLNQKEFGDEATPADGGYSAVAGPSGGAG